MAETRAQRTLVKSPPELWAEVSDLDALARHLGEFGEIRITRLEPETAVAWEGDRARGTVQLEPSGWGTRVTLTAEVADGGDGTVGQDGGGGAAADGGGPVVAGGDDAVVAHGGDAAERAAAIPPPANRPAGLFARLFGLLRRRPDVAGDAAAQAAATAVAEEPESVVEATQAGARPVARSVAKEAGSPTALEASGAAAVVAANAIPSADPAASPGRERPRTDPADERAIDRGRAEAILTEVLDDLGSARHRPFSRLG